MTTRRHLLQGGALASAMGINSAWGQEICAVPERQDMAGPIRLIANENPYGPSPKARQAMFEAFDEAHRYAMRASGQLRDRIAEREGVAKGNVMVAAGSGEILRMAGLATALKGQAVLAADPTFEMLQPYAEQSGAEVRTVPLDAEFKHDLEAMRAQVAEDVGLVYICNPNNPTGTLVDPDVLRTFCRAVAPKAAILVDEAYIELTDNPDRHSMADLVREGLNILVTRTFSKLHGMAGLRVGYALGSEDIIKNVSRYRMALTNTLGLRAAIASYEDLEFQAYSKAKILEGRTLVEQVCRDLSLPYASSATNFVFFDAKMPSKEFSAAMRERNILLRGVAGFDSHCRVSVGTVEQMALFQDALRDIVAG